MRRGGSPQARRRRAHLLPRIASTATVPQLQDGASASSRRRRALRAAPGDGSPFALVRKDRERSIRAFNEVRGAFGAAHGSMTRPDRC
ncbi:hypothetical protein K523DRAFT_321179 [Schizophyllum commune Tattone D]|nr:hypothetical protein K523DRAFT_321179 [Schizophyllum commune Tattone D]